jgi:hypothetical protein
MIQRVIFINKAGETLDMVLDIIGRKSKDLIVRHPETGEEFPIPRRFIESISEPEILKTIKDEA